ncbi:LVIVD repeat-containing protein [Caldithrix abyssi DSM 13497]|uniref:LVIVD repeat-containing protein n=1 Tax=Caldithrix abyssi DSM 13497 TaxID=880073 RepID=H1XQH2_CALAY|nr:T9SS type A sorting domain-containing protein [Caldithrix abyssi]APF19971.1 Por secretion system C-terminal sorting domain-containing protein [Caldithrix abyssi DSM 13497]EHO40059.1 LVIVD repeat-containing protein [Caldithrix abyssi DSM 13497]
MKRLLKSLLLIVLFYGTALPQNQIAAVDSNITLLGYLPIGYCKVSVPFGAHYLAITSGRGIRILDIADASHPVMVSEVNSGGNVSDIFVSGDYLYFTTEGSGFYIDENFTAGLTIVNISDPHHPVVESFYQSNERYFAVTGIDHYVYVSASSKVQIFDVSDPRKPTALSSYAINNTPKDLICYEQKLFVSAQNAGVLIYDLTDPSQPSLLGSIPVWASSVTVHDNLAAVSGNTYSVPIYSINDPANPQKLGEINSENNNDSFYAAVFSGSLLYITGSNYDQSTRFMLKTYDLTNPSAPVFKNGYFDTSGLSNSNAGRFISIEGQYALVATNDGLRILQLNDPAPPEMVSFYATNITPGHLQVIGNYAYFTYQIGNFSMNGFSIVDVSDPSCLRETGYMYLKPYAQDRPAIAVNGNRAYVIVPAISPDSARGLHVIDISDVGNPVKIQFIPLSVMLKDIIASSGDYLYFQTTNMETIYVYNISDPDNPYLSGTYEINIWDYGYAQDYFLDGNFLYVGTTKGLLILDRSAPANLQYRNFYTLPDGYYGVNGVYVSEQTAYLATQNGLLAVDISDVANPALLAGNSGFLMDVTLIGNDIYVANPGQGIFLYQLSGSNFVQEGYYDNKNYNLYKLFAHNDLIYATYEGLMIFQKGPSTAIQTEQQLTSANTFQLLSNYPNPFNPLTHIRFRLQKAAHVRLSIYNTAGQKVGQLLDAHKLPGEYELLWNAEHLSSGLYLIKMQAGNQTQTRKALLIK